MLRNAVQEVRFHPGRYVATLVAIAISIGFMVGVSVFIRTQSNALGQQESLVTSRADVVVDLGSTSENIVPANVTSTIKAVQGVSAVEPALQTNEIVQKDDKAVQATFYGLPSERFRWAGLSSGSWPSQPTQIALSEEAAGKLGVQVGDKVASGTTELTVSGISDDPRSLFAQTVYVDPAVPIAAGFQPSVWLIATSPGSDPGQVSTAIQSAVSKLPGMAKPGTRAGDLQVAPADEYRARSITALTGNFDVFKYMLMVFAGVALMVGMIIIFTTFLILLAQRRRQIGLMRTVGASGGQVRGQFFVESVIIGIIGSLLGIVLGVLIALAGAAYTGALGFGLVMPWSDLAIEFGIGVVATVLAAFVPTLRATRVAPLEALRPAPTIETRRTSVALVIISSVLVVAGALLAWQALRVDRWNIAWAMGSVALLGIGILLSTPVYVPWVIRGLGLMIRPFGATARLSTANAVRNPVRTALTTGVLMLAVGIIVTLQIGTATTRQSVLDLIDEQFPVDLSVTAQAVTYDVNTGEPKPATSVALPSATVSDFSKLPNLKSQISLRGAPMVISDSDSPTLVMGADASQLRPVSSTTADQLAPGRVLMSADAGFKTGDHVDVKGARGTLNLTVTVSKAMENSSVAMVNSADLAKLTQAPPVVAVWAAMAERTDMAQTLAPIVSMQQRNPDVILGGGALYAAAIEQVLNILLIVMTTLFGVAVVIALIGVANTLGLSVVERRRESALLRAMGMQRGSLRLMLFFEAVQMVMAGVLVGIISGGFFAWLGIKSVFKMSGAPLSVKFAVDWPTTIGLIAICFVAASLASILPGRRAAKATPTEALAEE